MTERLTAIEAQLNDLPNMKIDQIKLARRNLDDIIGKGATVGEEFVKRAQAAKDKCDRSYVIKLLDDARALAAQGTGSARAALTAFTLAEQEALRSFEAAGP